MLPKLKHRQNLKHPSTTELSGVTRLLKVQYMQESAGFEPKLGTGEGERKEQMRWARPPPPPDNFLSKKENKQGGGKYPKRESPLFLRSVQGLMAGERRRGGEDTKLISLGEAWARQPFSKKSHHNEYFFVVVVLFENLT